MTSLLNGGYPRYLAARRERNRYWGKVGRMGCKKQSRDEELVGVSRTVYSSKDCEADLRRNLVRLRERPGVNFQLSLTWVG